MEGVPALSLPSSPSMRPRRRDAVSRTSSVEAPVAPRAADVMKVKGVANLRTLGPYLVFEEIGAGAFGVVYRGIHHQTGLEVAIKCMDKQPTIYAEAVREADILQQAGGHPNCIRLIEKLETSEHVYLITEYCVGGDLYDYCFPPELKNHEGTLWVLEEEEALEIFGQILLALEHTHARGVHHGDVKLENVFLHCDERVILGDFGLAARFDPTEKKVPALATTHYCSPEAFLQIPVFGPEPDIWAAGVVLFIMLHGRFPFYGDTKSDVMYSICGGNPRLDDDISDQVRLLLRGLLVKNPAVRLTIPQIKRSPAMAPVFQELEARQKETSMEQRLRAQMVHRASSALRASDLGAIGNLTSVARSTSFPVSQNDFNLLDRGTRALDASLVPAPANPFLNGREKPMPRCRASGCRTTFVSPVGVSSAASLSLMQAIHDLQAKYDDNFDDLTWETSPDSSPLALQQLESALAAVDFSEIDCLERRCSREVSPLTSLSSGLSSTFSSSYISGSNSSTSPRCIET